jgi:hypothetical protein
VIVLYLFERKEVKPIPFSPRTIRCGGPLSESVIRILKHEDKPFVRVLVPNQNHLPSVNSRESTLCFNVNIFIVFYFEVRVVRPLDFRDRVLDFRFFVGELDTFGGETLGKISLKT